MKKIAITIDDELLKRLDRLVLEKRFPNRSRAIQTAIEEELSRLDRSQLAGEAAKLDPKFEQTLADQGLEADLQEWPEY